MNAKLKNELRHELDIVERHDNAALTVLYFNEEHVCIADSKGNIIGVLALEEPNDGSNFRAPHQHPLLHFYFKPGIDVKLQKMEVDYSLPLPW